MGKIRTLKVSLCPTHPSTTSCKMLCKVLNILPGAKIKIGIDGSYSEELTDGSQKKLEKASITLADCLACSGCITSAETVLIEQQSGEELQKWVFMLARFFPKSSGLCYKHMTIANCTSNVVNKLEDLLTDDARVIIYDRHVFIVQATGLSSQNF